MSKNEVSYQELDELSERLTEAIEKKPELSSQLKPILNNVQRMKVAAQELDELRTEYHRGDVTEDTYFNRRKKLRMDLVSAQDEIKGKMLDKLIENVKDEQSKSRLTRAKEAIVSNKDFILFLAELITKILPKP
jgi:hypothetical protein